MALYFAGCPKCGGSDGYLNVCRQHWAICHEHRTKWDIGLNLFPLGQDENSEVWEQNADELSYYRLVEPSLKLGPTDRETHIQTNIIRFSGVDMESL